MRKEKIIINLPTYEVPSIVPPWKIHDLDIIATRSNDPATFWGFELPFDPMVFAEQDRLVAGEQGFLNPSAS